MTHQCKRTVGEIVLEQDNLCQWGLGFVKRTWYLLHSTGSALHTSSQFREYVMTAQGALHVIIEAVVGN